MKTEPPDVIYVGKSEPIITSQNWLDLMEWSKGKDDYLYYRALTMLVKIK